MNGGEFEVIAQDNYGESVSLIFVLFKENEIENAQLGYSVDEQGNSLTENNEGDWQHGWVVIGYEEELGDPLIIDTSQEGYPILTAEHGAGDWEPIVLFNSLNDMKESIDQN